MVLTGSYAPVAYEDRHLSLVETETRALNQTAAPLAKDSIPGIRKMLTPNALVGILISAFIIAILIIGMLQLFYIQTPGVFTMQPMDFGKIEK